MGKKRIVVAEKDLVGLLRERDQRGFTILYDNYSSALYGVILKIVKSEETASDVMQEAFVKIWRNIESYERSKGSLFTWILNVARNTAIDKLRSQDYQQNTQNQPLEYFVSVVEEENPVEHQVDAIGVRKVVDQLRPEYRSIIDLVYFQGYTQAEVADELEIPLGTVKTRVKAALAQLRTLISILILLSYFTTYINS
ncbi:RNA polymerase subunit sigma-70 [Siphonobacter sp. BAB-5385]|uniref:RNA polymerase sigma factor n=1 Tax=unclassified Siphonobacter TaxID=2635712 RepID=UPI000B9ECD39|nr:MULTISPECIES: RNA polymerase sigma factor [unclassified Siphonobacter]OZI06675.1 RNA polymerase subunit sigma-70 [Siphonobacter sp. BAB-5385]PMD96451.1 RNA polymerase subunit sigma-70 [Siphonobacter sp. BAB-5405]